MSKNLDFTTDTTNTPYHFTSREILGAQKSPAMIVFLVDKGIVKNEKQAGIVVLMSIIVIIAFAAYIAFGSDSGTPTIDPSVPIVEVGY